MKKVRIAIAGNQWITRFLINKLTENKIDISLLITTSPEQSQFISGYEDLTEFAKEKKIAVYHPEKYDLKNEIDKKNLSNEIDLLFVFGWQRLIPGWLINECFYGAYGVHGGPLKPPRCRGRAILNWSMILDYKQFYIYLFKLTEGVDSGDIVEIVKFDVLSSDDILSLYHKSCITSSGMIIGNIENIINGTVNYKKQKGKPSYSPKRIAQHSGISWNQTAKRITNLIRAVRAPYPSAFTYLGSLRVDILRAHIFDTKINFKESPGTIIEVFPNNDFIVATKDYPLYVREFLCQDNSQIKRGNRFKMQSGELIDDPVL